MNTTTSRALTRRLPAIGIITLALLLASALFGAGAAQAATTRTVIWRVTSPAGFADRFATPQVLAAGATGCGLFQIDVYRYSTPSEVALVDSLVARGTLAGPEDGPVFVSNTDVTSTEGCAPATPTVSPHVTPSLPSAACVPASRATAARTATFSLDNSDSDTAVTYTVNGTDYAVGAGSTREAEVTVPPSGGSIAITAGDASWSYSVRAVVACAAPATPITVGTLSQPSTTVRAAAAPATPITPAADSVSPDAATAAADAAAAGTENAADADSLAFTGTDHLAEKLTAGLAVIAAGLGLVVADRRRRRATAE